MDRAVRLPGLRALDRNFDRLPESLRWVVERIVHDPEPRAPRRSRSCPPSCARGCGNCWPATWRGSRQIAGRELGCR